MFVFRLQKALEYRIEEEEKFKKEFLLKKNTLDLEKEKLHLAELEIVNTIHKFNDLRKGTLNALSLKNYESYLKKIKDNKLKQEKVVENWKRIVEEAKEVFIEARKEKKILEKLKEKKYEIYKQDELKKEQKFVDELSNSMYNRRNFNG